MPACWYGSRILVGSKHKTLHRAANFASFQEEQKFATSVNIAMHNSVVAAEEASVLRRQSRCRDFPASEAPLPSTRLLSAETDRRAVGKIARS